MTTTRWIVICAFLGISGAAHAQLLRAPSIAMGVDGGAAMTVSQGADTATGPALFLRAGYEFKQGLTPELALSYARWSRSVQGVDATEWQLSVLPGLRWSILGGAFRPWISFHVGYGHLAADVQGLTASDDGVGLNTGVGVDYLFTPRVGAGLHVTWNKVITDASADASNQKGEGWVDVGAGLALQL